MPGGEKIKGVAHLLRKRVHPLKFSRFCVGGVPEMWKISLMKPCPKFARIGARPMRGDDAGIRLNLGVPGNSKEDSADA